MQLKPIFGSAAVIAMLGAAPGALGAEAGADRMPVGVLIAAMFERGESRGDEPGELQLWVERLGMDTEYDFALGEDSLYMSDDGVLAVLLGTGVANAAASVMALGLDTRFDLSRAYWIVAGIAGVDRVLVLRTASNFTMRPEGQTAAWSRTQPFPDNGRPSLEAAFLVGNTVVQALVDGWERYRLELPGRQPE